VRAVSVAPDGSEQPNVTVRVEEFVSTQLRPLLNYIFFDENSADIPVRYTRLQPQQTGSFSVESLHGVETLPTYYHVLNILGQRLRSNPKSEIMIAGCNGGTGAERGNSDLSRRRAEVVRDYLRDVWGIAENRMQVKSRNLPETPSDTATADGVQENRRVEITSKDWNVMEPVVTNDTIRTVTPSMVRFYPSAQSEAGVSKWTLNATQSGRVLKSYSGDGEVPQSLDWETNEDRQTIPRSAQPIEFAMNVTDQAGQRAAAQPGSLAVEQVTIQKKREERIADKEIDRYGLILFDFDKSDLNAANRRIASFIKERIKPSATVSVTGYSDRIGDDEYNRKLSEARAKASARSLGISADRAVGKGESELLYDNELPEGRFYCRTVTVLVETPVTGQEGQ
jgi:outer membrane protein OmpA-like peptidoglycan-associated protein